MIWVVLAVFVLPFGFVLLYGAPYLPTRRAQAKQALDMLDLKEGDVFVDLGSGDGSVLIEAASRGLICYGFELNPFVWLISKARTRKFGGQITIYCKNFWSASLPEDANGVFVFLLAKYMERLDKKLTAELKKGSGLVSYTFQLPHKKPLKEVEALYYYKY